MGSECPSVAPRVCDERVHIVGDRLDPAVLVHKVPGRLPGRTLPRPPAAWRSVRLRALAAETECCVCLSGSADVAMLKQLAASSAAPDGPVASSAASDYSVGGM